MSPTNPSNRNSPRTRHTASIEGLGLLLRHSSRLSTTGPSRAYKNTLENHVTDHLDGLNSKTRLKSGQTRKSVENSPQKVLNSVVFTPISTASAPASSGLVRSEMVESQPEAGPSKLPLRTKLVENASAKGKNRIITPGNTPKVVEKRIMPGRIRRAAGGGAEGLRDLEEMVVDWLDRWGAISPSPPDNLQIHLSTLPLNLIQPAPYTSILSEPPPPAVNLTPTRQLHTQGEVNKASPRATAAVIESHERIETPTWVMVKPGDDDAEEAKEELGTPRKLGSVIPLKRKIRGGEETEDTSDAYYHLLHRKYEVFERRQRIREKEKLQFERYKMRSRIDLLKGMSKPSWTAVVSAVLSRMSVEASSATENGDKTPLHGVYGERKGGIDIWSKGREKIKQEGIDWLRDRLVREGEDVVKRYDQLLPVEPRKSNKVTDNRNSTPKSSILSPSLSPPPPESPAPVFPARVAALRDQPPPTRKRATSLSTPQKAESLSNDKPRFRGGRVSTSSIDNSTSTTTTQKRVVRDRAQLANATRKGPEVATRRIVPLRGAPKINPGNEDTEDDLSEEDDRKSVAEEGDDQEAAVVADGGAEKPAEVSALRPQPQTRQRSQSRSNPTNNNAQQDPEESSKAGGPFVPPLTQSGLPCLVEAAKRRHEATSHDENGPSWSNASDMTQMPNRQQVSRPSTRSNSNAPLKDAFGIPIPPAVESKSEFSLSDEEDFWPIIAHREAEADRLRRGGSLGVPLSSSVMTISATETSLTEYQLPLVSISSDEALEMEGVEAQVVI